MEDRLFFPLFFDLSDKRALVVGGGKIAARRTKALLPFVGHLTVVTKEASDELRALSDAGEIELLERPFAPEDLEGMFLAVCATGDETVDETVWRLCRERGVLVNIASDKDKCDFYFPGVARRGSVVAGVTAGGTNHSLAREVTEKIRKMLEE